MPSIYTQTGYFAKIKAEVIVGGLAFAAPNGERLVHIAGLPSSVARATADAFNDAWRKHAAEAKEAAQ